MTPLPKLIQEVISFYQHRDIWKARVKILNQEYHETVELYWYKSYQYLLYNWGKGDDYRGYSQSSQ
jgi:hypothetical protein